jgi:hypothetical protein
MEATTTSGRPELDVDAHFAEAEALLTRSANEVRALTERLRSIYSRASEDAEGTESDATGRAHEMAGLSQARALLSRLELITRDFEDDWRFLERGVFGQEWSDTGRAFVDEPGLHEAAGRHLAKRILEAQEQERVRLAAEIHDGPAQALTNATFQVEIIERLIARDPAAAVGELRSMRRSLDRELRKMRTFIHELRPVLDDAGGLTSGIAAAAEGLLVDTGIPTELHLRAAEELIDLDSRTAVLRITQEALRNVGKHSGAQHVVITTRVDPPLNGRPGDWILEIRDDGHGFRFEQDIEQSARHHFGLRIMRERAELVGARLEVASTEGAGTVVRLRVAQHERSEDA